MSIYSWAAAMDRCDELLARAEKAEAERDGLKNWQRNATEALTMWSRRAEAAEAERDELLELEETAARNFLVQVDLRKQAEAEQVRLREAANVAIGNLTVPGWIAPSAYITHAVEVLRDALADVPAGDGRTLKATGDEPLDVVNSGSEDWIDPAGDRE